MAVDQVAETDDLRSTIEAEFTKAETPVEVEPVETVESAGQEPEAEPQTEPKADHPSDPARYADGTFKPTKADAAPEKVEPPAKETPSTDTAKASTEPAPTPASAPPAGWTAAEKAEWAKLPPAVQAAVSRREQEISRGGQQWSEEKRRYEAVLSPVAQEAKRLGMPVDQALNALMGAHHALQRNAPAAIRQLCQQYGVDLATLAGSTAEGSPETVQPTDIARLVQQHVAPFLAPIQDRLAAEDVQRQQSVESLVEQFAASPGHEHFQAVEYDLMDLIPGIKTRNPSWPHEKVLQEAYDRAVYANPETRALMQAKRDAETDAKRIADAKTRTAQARRAGASVTGSPNGAAAVQPKDSLRAEIEAAMTGG